MATHNTSNSLTIRRISELCKDLPEKELDFLIELIRSWKEGNR